MIRLGEKSSFHDYQKVPLHFKRGNFENYLNYQQLYRGILLLNTWFLYFCSLLFFIRDFCMFKIR